MDRVEAEISDSPADHSNYANTFFTVAGEQHITRAIWRNPAPSLANCRHCSACSWLNAGEQPTSFPLTRARSSPNRIRSLVESTAHHLKVNVTRPAISTEEICWVPSEASNTAKGDVRQVLPSTSVLRVLRAYPNR